MIPFPNEAPPVTVDTLDILLNKAPAVLPEAICIGTHLSTLKPGRVYSVVSAINDALEGELTDGCLAVHYALATSSLYSRGIHNYKYSSKR